MLQNHELLLISGGYGSQAIVGGCVIVGTILLFGFMLSSSRGTSGTGYPSNILSMSPVQAFDEGYRTGYNDSSWHNFAVNAAPSFFESMFDVIANTDWDN